jgi:hypothetical protein
MAGGELQEMAKPRLEIQKAKLEIRNSKFENRKPRGTNRQSQIINHQSLNGPMTRYANESITNHPSEIENRPMAR